MTTDSSLGFFFSGSSGRGLRVRVTRDVMEGLRRHWWRTSAPMKPVAPERMSFITGLRKVSMVGGWENDLISLNG